MTWKAYRVAFRLLSPTHIGWRKLGNMQQTRPYVTGRVLWGAFTARLTRDLKSYEYKQIGEVVDKQLAFTYFYPSVSPNPDEVDLWPWGDGQKNDSQELFFWKFLDSYASTALSDVHSAEESSLHETEFIAPFVRNQAAYEKPQPVFLVGYICENEASGAHEKYVLENWHRVLDTLQIGGERSYGWGRVRLAYPLEEVTNERCFGCVLDRTKERPTITVPRGERLLAHTDTKRLETVENGTLEPLVGRETTDNTSFGKSVSHAQICWIPGSMVSEDETFQIQPRGIWQ